MKKSMIPLLVGMLALTVAVGVAAGKEKQGRGHDAGVRAAPRHEVVGSLGDTGPADVHAPPSRRPASRPRS